MPAEEQTNQANGQEALGLRGQLAFANEVQLARELLGTLHRLTHKGERNLPEVAGYPQNIDYKDYVARYERQDIAGSVIDKPVNHTWSRALALEGPPAEAFAKLMKRLRLIRAFNRVDKLASLGRYALLLMGVQAGESLAEPVARVGESGILFVQAFDEQDAKIDSFDEDPTSARFGKPQTYKVNFKNLSGSSIRSSVTVGEQADAVEVHHSRVIHVAADGLKNDVFGRPRLKRVFDRLIDLEKVVGGSAEMFFQGADRLLKFQSEHKLTDADQQKLTQQVTDMYHGLRRHFMLAGIDLDTVDTVSPDPEKIFDALIALIAGTMDIPQRILLGSERGQLASDQDRRNWTDVIDRRRDNVAEPLILRPFVECLQEWGALRAGEFTVIWPPVSDVDANEESERQQRRAGSMKDLTGGFPEAHFTREEIREAAGFEATPEQGRLPDATVENVDENDPVVKQQFARIRSR